MNAAPIIILAAFGALTLWSLYANIAAHRRRTRAQRTAYDWADRIDRHVESHDG